MRRGLFKDTAKAKQYLLVPIDHFNGWREALLLRKPNTERVIELLKEKITRHVIPRTIRKNPDTTLRSDKFKRILRETTDKTRRMSHQGP